MGSSTAGSRPPSSASSAPGRAAGGRAQRREAVEQAAAEQREPAGEADGLPDQEAADGVAGGPFGGGERPAGRLGEDHPEQEQAERGQLHVGR